MRIIVGFVRVQKTRNGFRLVEHGAVLSEVRSKPGPTHSVFDVLAALAAVFCWEGRLGVLGFAGGGMIAPLRFLGREPQTEACDLDRRGYELFVKHCENFSEGIDWSEGEAERWLKQRTGGFDLLIDDLSIPLDDDVFKPECSWSTLPPLIKSKLRRGGVVVANQLKPPNRGWKACMRVFEELFRVIQVIHLDDFENRIVIAGGRLPSVRETGRQLRAKLKELGSRQAARVTVRSWKGD